MEDTRKLEERQEVVIRCSGLKKSYRSQDDEKEVIRDLSFEVRKNEFLVLFGPGQCGKTTLLKLLAGTEKSDSGEIVIDGSPLEGLNRKAGMVYQDTLLFPWLNVMGNVEFGPRMRGEPRNTRRKRAQQYIDLVGLTGFERQVPVRLSGGMCQRVGIARAYCNDSDMIFMDEPFGHLDAQTRYQMEGEIERIFQNERKTIVFVTNNIEEALYLADRILLLSDCPAGVLEEYTVDFPRPRSYVAPEFLALRKEISQRADLRGE